MKKGIATKGATAKAAAHQIPASRPASRAPMS